MTPGRVIAVVGPSGVGKDSLMEALCAARPDIHRVRRAITRDAQAGGEDFDPVSECLFAARAAGGDFALHWQAHGLSYGIPMAIHQDLRRGQDCLVNLSRAKLGEAARVFDPFVVIELSAAPHILARRLAGRGREGSRDIRRRLARQVLQMPEGLTVVKIDNSGTLDTSVAAAIKALYPAVSETRRMT